MNRRVLMFAGTAVMLLSARHANAIAFLQNGDPAFNTARPSDALGVAWDSVGVYGGGGGTAISSRWFITSSHLGDQNLFTMLGEQYQVEQHYQVPGTDISIHRVNRDLPSFTPIYGGDPFAIDPEKTPLLLVGNGVGRSSAVAGTGGIGGGIVNEVQGWNVGGSAAKRWSMNMLDYADDAYAPNEFWWRAIFHENDFGGTEGVVTPGDSGGGAFIEEGGRWYLLGPINYAITEKGKPWATPNSSQSAGWLPQLYLDSIIDVTGMSDPRLAGPSIAAVPEPTAGMVAASAVATGIVATHHLKRRRKAKK